MSLLALAAAASVLVPAGTVVPGDVTTFGWGNGSCAIWISRPREDGQAVSWVLGYWSGLNAMNRVNSKVGINSDAQGIVAEVRRRCEVDPSALLLTVTARTYEDMETAGR